MLPSSSILLLAWATLSGAASSGTTTSSHSSSASAVSASNSGSSGVSGSSTLPPSTLVTVPFTLLSTNPTAVPVGSLTSGAPSQATTTLYTTFPIGSTPSGIPGAPPLPDYTVLNPANYPALDVPPPTDSPEVIAWVQEVMSSGIPIPDIPLTMLGGCAANPDAAANASASGTCWWPCGHCSRATDVVTCPNQFTWGSSFDDGPSPYTPDLLAYLDQNSLKTTFFTVGSRVISRPQILQTQYSAGHQIAVHTWSHHFLTTQSNEEVIAELGWSKQVIKDVLGVTPNFMRPPFGDIDDRIRAISKAMGLTPIVWTSSPTMDFTFDTNDFNLPGGTVAASQVIVNFENILQFASNISTGFIVLEHDLFQQTVDLAVGYILPDALANNPHLTLVPIVECLNKPLSDAYIETNNNNTNPPPNQSGGSGATAVPTLSSGAPGSLQNPTAAPAPSSNQGSALSPPSIFSVMMFGGLFALIRY